MGEALATYDSTYLPTNGDIDAFPWGAWPRDAAVDTRK